jgi:hypothetical protein
MFEIVNEYQHGFGPVRPEMTKLGRLALRAHFSQSAQSVRS